MKYVLIPTTLQHDTLCSVKTAVKHSAGNCKITLMLLNEAPDAECTDYYLRKSDQATTTAQCLVLESCRNAANAAANCRLEIHNQYGLSLPLLKNLIEHFRPNLIIIPASYKRESQSIHRYLLNMLANSKIPMLYLSLDYEEKSLRKALYLEQEKTQIGIDELQKHINGQFSVEIVSQAIVGEKYPAQLGPKVTEAIAKNNIDLLIETRKPEKTRKTNKGFDLNDTLGLPVLSIYEEAVI